MAKLPTSALDFGMAEPQIEFWFDFSSSYAYFASLEIEPLAQKHGREVVWRPFMLGTAFDVTGAKGLSRTPLKKEYAGRDWARLGRLRGVTFRLPPHHPSIALPATRAFYFLDETEPARAGRFAKAVFAAYYRGMLDTANPEQVARVGEEVGAEAGELLKSMADPRVKALAKARSEEAVSRGVFGSPWVFVDDEPFWGWDRLPMVDEWLSRGGW
jgi:2-hydroxychromene-2-carboxylate isomerase